MTDYIKKKIENGIGFLYLDRPQALNALSLEMIRALRDTLLHWRDDTAIRAVVVAGSQPKAFCAGGDIRFFYEVGTQPPSGGSALLEDFFTEEYALNHLIHHYPKPYVTFLDGIVMGGGMGISQSGPQARLRIVTEKTKMAMPEVIIGLFPDVGGSYFLTKCPGQLGRYLALSCKTIGAADAIYAGLADLFVPSSRLAELAAQLESAQSGDVRDLAYRFAAPYQAELPPGILPGRKTLIDRHFSQPTMKAIVASLRNETDPFGQENLVELAKGAPLMQCVTLEQLRRGQAMSVAQCLRMERTMVRRCFENGISLEGIRARVVDKDHAPRWEPASLDQVTQEMVNRFFEPAWPAHADPLRDLD